MYSQATECQIKAQVSLATLTSFRVGGPAEWYAAPRNLDQLKASFEYAETRDLAITMLGAGSNLLISDRGIPGLVISTRHLRHSEFDPQTGTVTVAAGEPLPRLAWQAAERGWQGLEWAVGIPGSVGGAVVMNAGAHKTCMADMLVNAEVLLPSGQIETLSLEELGYSYRTSLLQGSDRLVTKATLQLQPGFDSSLVMATTGQHLEQRKKSQPYHLPSCGSVFRNPLPYTAGWLIEQSGLKGYQVGAAQIAQRHANFILNCGGAKANDIYSLINHVQQQVQQNWSVWLHPEVRMLGEFQPIGY
ncbi:UDP-N-acetylmuramate dehydrogenase [Chlorogloea sp. CCALA 695]|uniref:UDP-N-acetylmuramate dehydrogenase n=1 Tax=Chlorogloea sp. CCALA 695 TaxID=2107693 RepID=UPI000D058B40|nr:UDP-N-acetylmuramate dehydrogenase [Chlorogloea sp. CCALA 695]PSB32400.1 UDP-N-acetylenolpyruvoylglucosamine reductase [Chlorogloea sp. CCALA 695]